MVVFKAPLTRVSGSSFGIWDDSSAASASPPKHATNGEKQRAPASRLMQLRFVPSENTD